MGLLQFLHFCRDANRMLKIALKNRQPHRNTQGLECTLTRQPLPTNCSIIVRPSLQGVLHSSDGVSKCRFTVRQGPIKTEESGGAYSA